MSGVKVYLVSNTVDVEKMLSDAAVSDYVIEKKPDGSYIVLVSDSLPATTASVATEVSFAPTQGRDYSYKLITPLEQMSTLVQFLAAQERDLYCHTTNLQRYNAILGDPTINGDFRARITQLKEETESRISEVNTIIKYTLAQMGT